MAPSTWKSRMSVAMLHLHSDNRGIRWFLAVDFRLDETCIIKQFFQIFRRIGRHALHHAGPFRITVHYLYQDGKLTTGLQHTTHLLQTVGE